MNERADKIKAVLYGLTAEVFDISQAAKVIEKIIEDTQPKPRPQGKLIRSLTPDDLAELFGVYRHDIDNAIRRTGLKSVARDGHYAMYSIDQILEIKRNLEKYCTRYIRAMKGQAKEAAPNLEAGCMEYYGIIEEEA